ncbi:MAG: hypothetical protein EXQ74_05435 [Thermoleophilia bacterium]|nr:hypothetical protein [Thermoleophilia bacterium]
MATDGQPSRPLAIALVVLAALAFIGVLAGLAIGRMDLVGISAVALVGLWFGLRWIPRAGHRR